MAVWILCQMLLIGIACCQAQNPTDQSDSQNAFNQYPLTNQNTTSEFVTDVNEQPAPFVETVTNNNVGVDGNGNNNIAGSTNPLGDFQTGPSNEVYNQGSTNVSVATDTGAFVIGNNDEYGNKNTETGTEDSFSDSTFQDSSPGDGTVPIDIGTDGSFSDSTFQDNSQEEDTAHINKDLQNCSLPAVLNRYCEDIPDDVHRYFKFDLTVRGILASIFKRETVESLQLNCSPGNWCLPESFYQEIKDEKQQFYIQSPFCSEAMLECIRNMQELRANCTDEELLFLTDTISLLCDLEDMGYLNKECYAKIIQALYVTYADMINPGGSRRSYFEQDDCNNYRVQFITTLLCTDDACNFDQNNRMEQYRLWTNMLKSAASVAATCNISRSCQSDSKSSEPTQFPYDYFDDSSIFDNYDDESDGAGELSDDESNDDSKSLDDKITEEESEIEEQEEENESVEEDDSEVYGNNQTGNENEVNADTDSDDGYDKNDRSMMLGLIVMTTALLFGFIGLAYVVYRRFQRARNGNYKWGYSQLSTDDSRLVQKEFK